MIVPQQQKSVCSVLLLSLWLSGCAWLSARSLDSVATKTAELVDATTSTSRRQMQALGELEAMGEVVVPYLVAHLDDMRPLATDRISLVNKSPDAFEAFRHYSPKVVHDALAAILNQITGNSFVFVYNGATSQQRKKIAIYGWLGVGRTIPSRAPFAVGRANRSLPIRRSTACKVPDSEPSLSPHVVYIKGSA